MILFLFLLPSLVFSLSCDFSVSLCDWAVEKPWQVASELLLPCPIHLMPRKLNTDPPGPFLAVQGRFGGIRSGDVISPILEPSPVLRKLTYTVSKPSGEAVFKVILRGEDSGSERLLDSVDSNSVELWTERTTIVPPIKETSRIIFRAEAVHDGFDVIGLRKVHLEQQSPGLMEKKGVDYHLFSDLKRREIRRSPGSLAPSVCKAVACDFHKESCAWSSSGFRTLDGKMVTEGEGAGLISSGHALLPVNAHLQMDIFASDGSSVSVWQHSGSGESLLWTQSGVVLPGWNTIRVPVKYSALPSSFSVRSSTPRGSFVAVAHSRLVDTEGNLLACGLNVPAILPQRDSTLRLTAVQKVDGDNEASSWQKKEEESQMRMAPPRPQLPQRPPTPEIALSGHASSPIAPAMVSSQHPSVFHSSSVDRQPSLVNSSPLAPPTMTSRLHLNQMTSRIHESHRPIPIAPAPIAPPTMTSPLQQLLQSAIGNPAMESQLKMLAKRFGFSGLSPAEAERKLSLFKGIMRGTRQQGGGEVPPIKPIVNAKAAELAPKLPFTDIQGEIAAQLGKLLELPDHRGAESRPFSRQNMDLVVQNAFDAYMHKARP